MPDEYGNRQNLAERLCLTIDFQDFPLILLEPRIAQSVFSFPDGNNFAADTKHCPIFDNAEFFQH